MSMLPITYNNYNGLNSLNGNSSQGIAQQSGLSDQASAFSGSKSEIRSQVEALLANIPKGEDGKLSFQEVDDYRENLEKEWDDSVKADLAKLGVDVEKEMPLSWDPATGKLTVHKDHPNKDVIDNYFASNPDKIDEFERIIKLGKLTSTHTQKMEPSQMRQSIQQQSMAWWYEDNSDPTSWFKGGGRMLGATMATYKGLNMQV